MALVSILLLYLGVGILAAIGTVTITRQRFTTRTERVFFALLLLPVAAIYLAFIDYFNSPMAWRPELWATLVFAALGLLGLRVPRLIIIGYILHGAWDLLHEFIGLRGVQTPYPLTPIPLAYGVFCAAYDWGIAWYLGAYRPRHSD